MTHCKLVKIFFIQGMQVLEFMQSFKTLNVQSVGKNHFGCSFQQVFTFTGSYFTYGCKYRTLLSTTIFNSCLGDYAKSFSFLFPTKKRKMRIEQWRVDGQVPTELGGMRGEYSFYWKLFA